MTKPDTRMSTLPEQFTTALPVDEPDDIERATLIEDGVHYDTEHATCIGQAVDETAGGSVTRLLYRGENGRMFRHRIEYQSEIRHFDRSIAKLCCALFALIGLVGGILAGVNYQVFGVEQTHAFALGVAVFDGAMIVGMGAYPAFFYVRQGLCYLFDRSEPMTVADDEIEPLTYADLLADPKSEAERRLAHTIRNDQPTWDGPTGTVTKLPNGSWLYEHDSGMAGRSDREGLRDAIERQNDPVLYRKLFDDDYERA